jgi:hypothetical protein
VSPSARWPIIAIVFIIFIALLPSGIWLAVFAPEPFTYNSLPWDVQPRVVLTGETLVIDSYRCNNDGAPLAYTILWSLVREADGTDITLPQTFATAPPGCSEHKRGLLVPIFLQEGYYHIEGVAIVRGRFRDSEVPFTTRQFRVLP